MNETGCLGHGLEHAGLVVRQLDGDQHAFVASRFQLGFKPGQIKDSVGIDRDDLDGFRCKPMPVEHTGVLSSTEEEAGRSRLPQAAKSLRQNEIGSLGAAAREDDVFRPRAHETGHLLAGPLNLGPRSTALGMDGGRISRELKSAQHGLGSLRPQGRGRIMVEICALACRHSCREPHEILAIDLGCRAKAPQPHLSDVSSAGKSRPDETKHWNILE